MRRRINISIEDKVWRKFQKFCIDLNIYCSYEIQRLIEKELKRKK